MRILELPRGGRTALLAGLLGCGLALSGLTDPAFAIRISAKGGEVTGYLDTTVSLGASLRASDRDLSIIGRENGGTANSVNGDNGNLNFDSGDFTSATSKVTHELQIDYKRLSLFSRGFYFYDAAVMSSDPARTSFSQAAEDEIGANFTLLDAYLALDLPLGPTYLTLRGGNQVLSWGESTFIQNGINTLSPIDVSKLRVAGAELRDGLTALPAVDLSWSLTQRFSVEGFYQFLWEQTEIEPEGTFFSTNDFASPGGQFVMLGFGAPGISDDPYLIGGNPPVGTAVPRMKDREARDDGQFGVALRWFEPMFRDTEFGFYYTNLHSRLPVISAITGSEQGLGAADYASSARYFREYPEDIETFGFSFSTELPTGIAIQGEASYHKDQPLQADDVELLFAALAPLNAQVFSQSQLVDPEAPPGFNQEIPGWRPQDMIQVQTTVTEILGPHFGADQWALVGEVGYTKFPDLEDPSVLRYEAAGTYTSGNDFFTQAGIQPATQTGGFGDDVSWGYRLLARGDFNGAIGAINLSPSIAWTHDPSGTTPSPIGNFIEGRKTVTGKLTADYLATYRVILSYTNSFGGDEFNLLNDRDFISLTASYSF